jgi:HEAT repeat protein
MKLTLTRPYGYSHLKRMEKAGDSSGLIEALNTTRVKRSANLRAAVVTSLKRIGDSKAVPTLSRLLVSDPAEPVRRGAAVALGQLRDADGLPALREALDDDSVKVQMWAIRSLGELRDRESVERLIGMLDDPDWGVRSFAVSALGEIGDQRAVEALVPRLDDSNSTVRLGAKKALGELGYPGRPTE